MPSIQYLGKRVGYRNVNTLARKLKITVAQANTLINEPEQTKYIVSKDGGIKRFKLNENPLFEQEFNIKRKTNSKIISRRPYNIKGKTIVSNLEDLKNNHPIKVRLDVTLKFDVSQSKDEIRSTYEYITLRPIERHIKIRARAIARSYCRDIVGAHNIRIVSYEIFSEYSGQKMELVNNKLRDVKPLKIFYENIDTTEYNDCVRDYLKKIYKKISPKTIDKLGDENGVSINELYTFCEKYRIFLLAYDINGNVIKKHVPAKKNKSYKSLVCIAHNNHLYPLKNKTLQKLDNSRKCKIELVDDADNKLREFIIAGVEPANVHTMYKEKGFIRCFTVDGVIYLENKDYNKCYEILKKFGIEEKMTPFTTLSNITEIIMTLYDRDSADQKINIDSFVPQFDYFTKGGFCYNRPDIDDYDDVKTIDKNKCYPSCLSKLKHLIQLDIRQSTITKFTEEKQPKRLIDHYLYIAVVERSNILLPCSNVYSGEHLNYAKTQGCKFMIKEEITTNKIWDNFFDKMINDIFKKCDHADAKNMLNRFIGKFENCKQVHEFSQVDRICTEDEKNSVDGYKRQIEGTTYYVVETKKEVYDLVSRRPLAIQIKDASRRLIYDKIKELKISQDDVVNINTDSITFIDRDNIMAKIKLNKKDIHSWKEEVVNPDDKKFTKKPNLNNNPDLSFEMVPTYKEGQKTVFYDCYAGTGKTYHIINKLIPKLPKKHALFANEDEEFNYKVLTPSHAALEDYRKSNHNCDVIQKYSLNPWLGLPKEENIIIDEYGLCDRSALNIVHKCILAGKNVYAYGDFKQLLPVFERTPFDCKTYLKSIYKEHKNLKENMRNDFSIDYYDDIINGNTTEVKEVRKHQTKWKDADIVICYTNATCKIYNDKIMKQKGFKDKFQVGVSLICKTNKLRKKGVYNNFVLTVKENDGDTITLSDDVTYDKDDIDKYFRPAYARTAYGIQGKSVKSFYYAKEDYYCLKNNPRLAYTVISRLKTRFKYAEEQTPTKTKKCKKVKKCRKANITIKSNKISIKL